MNNNKLNTQVNSKVGKTWSLDSHVSILKEEFLTLNGTTTIENNIINLSN